MFPRRERIPRALFPTALKGARRLSSANLSLVVPDAARGYAIVVSKKTARLSATRHRIKRRISAALRSLPFPLPPSLIIFPKSSAGSISYEDIRAELATLIPKKHR